MLLARRDIPNRGLIDCSRRATMAVRTQTSFSLALWTTLISAFLVPSHVGAQFSPDSWGQMWHDDLCGSGNSCHTGDFNGDGRDDIIAIDQLGSGHVALAGAARVLGTTVAPDGTTFDETQPGFGPSAVWGSAVCYPEYEKCVVGDFNGDGRDDVVAIGKAGGSIYQSTSLGNQFYAPTFWGNLTGPCDDQSLCNSADVNGDQIDDLLRFPRGADGKVYVSLATGSETFWPEVNVASWDCMDGYQCMADDVDGDGRADLIVFTRGTTADVWVALSTSYGNTASFGSINQWHNWFCAADETCATGDVNGDGRADIITFTHGAALDVYVAFAESAGYFSPSPGEKWHDRFSWSGEIAAVGDFNGDHLADIATFAVPYRNVHIATATNENPMMAVDDFTVAFVSPADHDKFEVYLFFDDASIEFEDTSFRVASDLGGECGAVVATTMLGSGQIQRVVRVQLPLWQIGANRVWVQAISGPGSLTTYAEPSLHEVRFGEPAPNWGLQLLYPATSFNTPYFQLPFSPHITSCTHQVCKDADLDGLLDAWENVAVHSNRPILLIDPDDGFWGSGNDEIFSFSRVTPMRRVSVPSERAIFIGTSFGWSRDYGNPTFGGAHTGDAEAHVSVWKDVGNGGFEYVGQMTAAHNALFDHVEYYWEWVGGIGYLRVTPEGVIRLWAEEDKHGTWPSDFECGGAGGYDCGATYQDDFRPESYNIGEGNAYDSFAPGRILIDDLNHVHEFGPHEVLFDIFPDEALWRLPQHGQWRFCGGLPCDGSPPTISSKISTSMTWTAANSSQHYETDLAPTPSMVTCGTP